MTDEQHPSIDELKIFPAFDDLQPEELAWLAEHFNMRMFESGETISEPGTAATEMVAIFAGEMQARRETPSGESVYLAPAGTLTGKLPFSRMKSFPSLVRAVGRTRVGRMHESDFPEMLQRIPALGERLVGVLADRVREVAKIDYSREKLAALGKLSAGLAHELNNPASAARRSAANLREALKQLAEANLHLSTCPMTDAQREQLAQFESDVAARFDSLPILDSLEQSDREQELIDWLDKHGVKSAWAIAPTLADTGMDAACLNEVLAMTGPRMLGSVLCRIAGTFAVERLLREIESSTERISEMVRAVKEYSYMDRAKEQEIDIHRGLDTTITMLSHLLKTGVTVTKEYDKSIPKIMANGGELNQVWTNLIDNAIDAMKGKGELGIRTAREADMALVEISDNGPGIPADVQARIFEPFFTTKGVGQGTGLGLDFVYRIVGRHHGEVRFTSEPGHTVFQIRLPLVQPGGVQPGGVQPGAEQPEREKAGAQTNESVYAHQSD